MRIRTKYLPLSMSTLVGPFTDPSLGEGPKVGTILDFVAEYEILKRGILFPNPDLGYCFVSLRDAGNFGNDTATLRFWVADCVDFVQLVVEERLILDPAPHKVALLLVREGRDRAKEIMRKEHGSSILDSEASWTEYAWWKTSVLR